MTDSIKSTEPEVPEHFYKGHDKPVAQTVGELHDLLAELPRDMPLKNSPHASDAGDEAGMKLTVYNMDANGEYRNGAFLDIEEAEDDDDDLDLWDDLDDDEDDEPGFDDES